MEKIMNSSEQFEVNDSTALQYFNLSQKKSLRVLETTAGSIHAARGTASDFLRPVLSSITSPMPLDVVIFYEDHDFAQVEFCVRCHLEGCYRHPWDRRDRYARNNELRVLHEMHRVRDFRLVLCANVSDDMTEHAAQSLECILEVESDYRLYKPVTFKRRTHHPHYAHLDCTLDLVKRWSILASAL